MIKRIIILLSLAVTVLAGCISNDIPAVSGKPASIVEMVAEGAEVTIDQTRHIVVFNLNESTDIRNVRSSASRSTPMASHLTSLLKDRSTSVPR